MSREPRRPPDNLIGRYWLDGTEVVPFGCDPPSDAWLAWARWFEGEDNRLIAWDEVAEGVVVSTIFLGLDHNFFGGPPHVFETMVFGPYGGGEQHRYASWDDAWDGHHAILKRLQKAVAGVENGGGEKVGELGEKH